MARGTLTLAAGLAIAALASGLASAATPIQPTRDNDVVEVLQSATRVRFSPLAVVSAAPLATHDVATALQVARRAVQDARQSGDTRYWGRAQAALAPWWNAPTAPVAIAVLQTTVQQGRHEFSAAHKVLLSAVAREPGNAQAWLTLASLERLSARYDTALRACAAVARAGQPLYAQACTLETESLQGAHAQATRGLRSLLAQATDPEQRSWLLSLLAEAEERAGHDLGADRAYQNSLALSADLYTALAHSDLQLRTGRYQRALQTLQALPDTDAVVLRRAVAMQKLNKPAWTELRATLRERDQALLQRSDDPQLHGRERALVALWLDHDARRALLLARDNLTLQREPLDWWVALQSAQQAGITTAINALQAEIKAVGLHDARLSALSQRPVTAPGTHP
jgi:hypothetical protein